MSPCREMREWYSSIVAAPPAVEANRALAQQRRGFHWRTSLDHPVSLLIAHPEPDFRCLLARGFRAAGCQVGLVYDGQALIDRLADDLLLDSEEGRPDLIVASLGLPGRPAVRLLSDLRAAGWSTPFVLTAETPSAKAGLGDLAAGQMVVFERPFEVYDLITAAMFLVYRARRMSG